MIRFAKICATGLLGGAVTACYSYQPPGPPVPSAEQPVNASFGKTWDAVIDLFAEQNISIATIERASGLIVASPGYLERSLSGGAEYADCGKNNGLPVLPTRVGYNVRVKGDSTKSMLRVNAVFVGQYTDGTFQCSTRNVWETQVWARIAAKAEGK